VGTFGAVGTKTIVNDASIGTVAFSNLTNILLSDNLYASAVLTLNQISQYIKATNFNFSIPLDAIITGIVVDIERFASVGSAIKDNSVKLVKGGSVVGVEKAIASTWPTSEAFQSYGNSTDLWSTSLTPADVNSSSFGVAISVIALAAATANVDHIRMTVHFMGSNKPFNFYSRFKSGDGMSVVTG
jgi:hypothetical protein